jgi:hypothetical protein
MMDSLINSIAAEIFPPEGSEVNPMANMPHHRMVARAYGYATKPWVGLTDEEVADIERNCITRRQAIRAVEAKLKEKNA